MSTALCRPPRLGSVDPKETIAALATNDLLARYRRGVENYDRRLFLLRDEQLDQAFLPESGLGRWPVRVVLGHVMDADLVAVHRMRRAVAEDNPVFADWDENAFVESNLYGVGAPPGGGGAVGWYVALTHTLRQGTAQWAFSLSDAQLARTGMHPVRGVMSVRDILVSYTHHLEHHAAYLNAKVERFLGPAPEEPVPAGGCGPGCGCKPKG
ncbi:MAG: DinB family protein [Phycisphaeraceae bacterium]|nr:MAG: DinB family protein [Phycisphaeraceae bacterium]